MSKRHDDLPADDVPLAERLERERPAPAAGFRGALGRYLVARDPGYGPRPENLHVMVGTALAAGGVLIGLGLLQAAGAL